MWSPQGSGIGFAGLLAGSRLARILPVVRLQQSFAVFVLALGVVLLVLNVPKLSMFPTGCATR
ncbi:hypothetical protein [Ktedonobacter robiniae]|uniref:hypothetical protein n=1 Tax=Ktedonobacter robiniae TaxID=2778365 RepID=UPI001915B4A0|nr:hypothetical protein [Ktedonobacter robiniae]